MTDVLLRGLAPEIVRRYEQEAARLHLSRNELMVRRLEAGAGSPGVAPMTAERWDEFAASFADLGDAELMHQAWQ